jgi:hypothetical protein
MGFSCLAAAKSHSRPSQWLPKHPQGLPKAPKDPLRTFIRSVTQHPSLFLWICAKPEVLGTLFYRLTPSWPVHELHNLLKASLTITRWEISLSLGFPCLAAAESPFRPSQRLPKHPQCLPKAPQLPKDPLRSLIRSVTHHLALFLGICVKPEVLGTLFCSLTPSWPAHQLHNLLKASLTITCWKMTLSSLNFFFYPCWCLTASVAMGDVQFWSSKCLLKAPELPKDSLMSLIRSVTHQVSLFLGLHLWIRVKPEVLGTLLYSLTPSLPAHQLHNLLKASLTITCWKMTLSSLNFFFYPCWCLTASVAMGDVQFWSSKCLLKAPELPKDSLMRLN